ncbi:MAG: hypothetical protein H6Q30_1432 [Bacteroidetes bacterium]|nr:hypothetical protein [Bacteroidota bacterium]
MIERDYFMRMINILTQMIARTLFLKNKMEFPKALQDIQTTGKTLLGIDGDLARRLSPKQIMQIFGSDLTVAVPKSYVAAILMKEEADVRALMGEEEESVLLYVRSLALLLDVLEWANEAVEPNHVRAIDEVLEKLKGYTLSVELLDKLLGFQERMGRYDKAENVLYDILEVNPEYRAEGMLFYKRLLEKKDSDLELGGLPREEVVLGMEQIAKR